MAKYKPIMNIEVNEITFTREELISLLKRLDENGASIIGVDIEEIEQ